MGPAGAAEPPGGAARDSGPDAVVGAGVGCSAVTLMDEELVTTTPLDVGGGAMRMVSHVEDELAPRPEALAHP